MISFPLPHPLPPPHTPSPYSITPQADVHLPNVDKIQAIHNLDDADLTEKDSFSYKIVSSACYDFCKFLAEICPFEGEYKGSRVNAWVSEQFNRWFANFPNLQASKSLIRSRMISCNFRKARLRAIRRAEQNDTGKSGFAATD